MTVLEFYSSDFNVQSMSEICERKLQSIQSSLVALTGNNWNIPGSYTSSNYIYDVCPAFCGSVGIGSCAQ